MSSDAWAYRVVGIEEPGDLSSELGWRDVLAAIQRNLKQLGYYKRPIDGRYGDAMRKAVDRYRRRNGIIDKETIWPAVLIHMQVLGEAIQVQKPLKAARIRQIGVAKTQLLKRTAARDLLASTMRKESADPTHNPSICFAAPTLRCLLDEALESIHGVTRDRYRNWALQDLIVILAAAGMVEPEGHYPSADGCSTSSRRFERGGRSNGCCRTDGRCRSDARTDARWRRPRASS
jgi:hypothetical protein